MEFQRIEREVRIDADPAVVYEVISQPEHIRQWWSDDVALAPVAGARGYVAFGDPDDPAKVVQVAVVVADPPRRFAFRWTHEQGQDPAIENSLLVSFDLEPVNGGTVLRFCETGFRERGWTAAVLEQQYRDHEAGWDRFLPRLADHVSRVGAGS